MIMSMTGFGKTETQWEDKNLSIEIRSLNSKNADINLKNSLLFERNGYGNSKTYCTTIHRGKIDLKYISLNLMVKMRLQQLIPLL